MRNYIDIKNKNLKSGLIWTGIAINTAFFIWFFVSGNIDPAPRFQVMNHGWRFVATLTFWTTQVCAMNVIFPIIVAMNGKFGIWKPGYQSWISFMAFNLMCILIFWAGFTDFTPDSLNDVSNIQTYSNVIFSKPEKLIITLWAHMFAPLASIIVFILFVPKLKIDVKSYYRAASPFCISYLAAWFLLNIGKMFVMYAIGFENIATEHDGLGIGGEYQQEIWCFLNSEVLGDSPGFNEKMTAIGYLSAPYFFFNFTSTPNSLYLMLGVAFGAVLVTIAFQYIVIYFANLAIKRRDSDAEYSNEYKKIQEKFDGKWFEVVKIVIYTTLIGIGIYKLTQTQHYINTPYQTMYNMCYLLVTLVVLLGSIAGIVMSMLYILNIATNPTWTIYIGLLIGGWGISAFFVGIPLIIITVAGFWYKSNRTIVQ
ncbi:hypothetical protein [Spiroplasma endosymbiont of Othius punctulatus]|uniref:hypothetical protein n=1 Tax=Spiroplasma endosymbiont of Othius punctulatus TaxID=3066289 RepID=UPI0030D1997A